MLLPASVLFGWVYQAVSPWAAFACAAGCALGAAALLFTGTVQVVATANGGALARRSLGLFLAVLGLSAATALTLQPGLLRT